MMNRIVLLILVLSAFKVKSQVGVGTYFGSQRLKTPEGRIKKNFFSTGVDARLFTSHLVLKCYYRKIFRMDETISIEGYSEQYQYNYTDTTGFVTIGYDQATFGFGIGVTARKSFGLTKPYIMLSFATGKNKANVSGFDKPGIKGVFHKGEYIQLGSDNPQLYELMFTSGFQFECSSKWLLIFEASLGVSNADPFDGTSSIIEVGLKRLLIK